MTGGTTGARVGWKAGDRYIGMQKSSLKRGAVIVGPATHFAR